MKKKNRLKMSDISSGLIPTEHSIISASKNPLNGKFCCAIGRLPELFTILKPQNKEKNELYKVQKRR